jgi:hypothetical protein
VGSIGIVSLTNSAKSKIDLLPNNSSSCKGAARDSGHPVRCRSGRPAVRWSVSSRRRSRIRRTMVVDTRRRLEDLPRSRLTEQRLGCSVVPGATRSLQFIGLVRPLRRFGSSARSIRAPGAGGDEETRTPDPLLAKEMLCQLSYVPSRRTSVVGVSGLEPETSALSGQCSNQLS